MAISNDPEQIITLIKSAFEGVTLEDGVGLSEADAIDSYASSETRKAFRENDEKYEWAKISAASLNTHYSSLNFFDAKGMRFHLPAFLLAEINGEFNFGMTFTLAHLSDYRIQQFALLNRDQRTAVRLFLNYLSDNPDYASDKPEIERAIERFWSL